MALTPRQSLCRICLHRFPSSTSILPPPPSSLVFPRQRTTTTLLTPTISAPTPPLIRNFSCTPHTRGNKNKNRHKSQEPATSPSGAAASNSPGSSKDSDDLFDTSTLTQSIEKAKERLTHELSQLKPGGRFNPGILEGLKVELPSSSSSSSSSGPSSGSSSPPPSLPKNKGFMKRNGGAELVKAGNGANAAKASAKLGDLAQVIPRGRMIVVIVSEREYIKPIIKAIQSSDLNLTPLPSSSSSSSSSVSSFLTNPSSSPGIAFGTTNSSTTTAGGVGNINNNENQDIEIHIPLPPPTKETQTGVIDQAKRFHETANRMIQEARHAYQKRLKRISSGGGGGEKGSGKEDRNGAGKKWGRDDMTRATKMMESEVEKAVGEVKKIAEGAKRVLEKI